MRISMKIKSKLINLTNMENLLSNSFRSLKSPYTINYSTNEFQEQYFNTDNENKEFCKQNIQVFEEFCKLMTEEFLVFANHYNESLTNIKYDYTKKLKCQQLLFYNEFLKLKNQVLEKFQNNCDWQNENCNNKLSEFLFEYEEVLKKYRFQCIGRLEILKSRHDSEQMKLENLMLIKFEGIQDKFEESKYRMLENIAEMLKEEIKSNCQTQELELCTHPAIIEISEFSSKYCNIETLFSDRNFRSINTYVPCDEVLNDENRCSFIDSLYKEACDLLQVSQKTSSGYDKNNQLVTQLLDTEKKYMYQLQRTLYEKNEKPEGCEIVHNILNNLHMVFESLANLVNYPCVIDKISSNDKSTQTKLFNAENLIEYEDKNVELSFVAELVKDEMKDKEHFLNDKRILKNNKNNSNHERYKTLELVPPGMFYSSCYSLESEICKTSNLHNEAEKIENKSSKSLNVKESQKIEKESEEKISPGYLKYKRMKHRLKALIFQKHYLTSTLNNYQEIENCISFLFDYVFSSLKNQHFHFPWINIKPRGISLFRSVTYVIISILRMQFLVLRWKKFKNCSDSTSFGIKTQISSSSKPLKKHWENFLSNNCLKNNGYDILTSQMDLQTEKQCISLNYGELFQILVLEFNSNHSFPSELLLTI